MNLKARILALFASALLFGGAHSAEEHLFAPCEDGETFAPVGETSTRCPPTVSIVGFDNVGAGGFDVTFNTSGSDGSAYVYLKKTDTGRPWFLVRSGLGASAHSGAISISSSGSYTETFSGLDADTTYYGLITHVSASGRPSRVKTFEVVTTAAATPGSAISGYFMDCNATVSGDGTSHEEAVKTAAELDAITGLSAGDDMWVYSGCNLPHKSVAPYTFPKVSGTPTNQAIFGCYYLDPANSNQPTDCREGSLGGYMEIRKDEANYGLIGPDGNETLQPWTVTGALTEQCIEDKNCQFSKGFMSDCAGPYSQIFSNLGKSYTTVTGGHIRKSSCMGMRVGSNGAGGGSLQDISRHNRLINVMFSDNGQQPFQFQNGQRHPFLRSVVADSSNRCVGSQRQGGTSTAQIEMDFVSGGVYEVQIGDVLVGASSGDTGWVEAVTVSSGSWAAGNAAGTLYLSRAVAGDFQPSEIAAVSGGVTNALTVSGQTRNSGAATNCGKERGGWNGGIALNTSYRAFGLYKDVAVYGSGGEGLNFLASSHAVVLGAITGNTHATATYPDGASDILIDSSIIWGRRGNTGEGPNTAVGNSPGWTLGFENTVNDPFLRGDRNLIRNSLIVGNGSGLEVGVQTQKRANAIDPRTMGGYFLHNVVIAPTKRAVQGQGNVLWSDFEIGNSVFIDDGAELASICTGATHYNYNYWGRLPSLNCRGANDLSGTPGIALDPYNDGAVRNQYLSYDMFNIPKFSDVYPLSGSQLIGAGSSRWTTDTYLEEMELWEPVFNLIEELDTPAERAAFAKYAALDHQLNARSTTNPSLGLYEGTGTTPTEPTGEDMVLSVSPNGRYFRKNGAPFVWVGCTAWLMTDQSTADMDTYLNDRASRGCNVVQGPIMLNLLDDIDTVDGPISSTSPFTMREQFFIDKVDPFIDKATAKDMFILFPLAWGPNIKRDVLESAANATTFASYVVSRYSDHKNIIWMPGGEYTKITTNSPDYDPNSDTLDANERAILDAYIAAIQANKNADALMTIHPDGGRSSSDYDRHSDLRLHDASWLDFNTLQSYASNEQNILDTVSDYDSSNSGLSPAPVKPVLQSENFYEDTLVGGVTNSPWHIRMSAYSHWLSGGAGYSYGHGLIWRFASGWDGAGVLGDEGADDIFTHYKAFVGEHHDESLIPARDYLASGLGSASDSQNTYRSVLRNPGSSKLIAYTPKGFPIYVNTNKMTGTLSARWFNPRTGAYTSVGSVSKSASVTFDPPGGTGEDLDWALVIEQE